MSTFNVKSLLLLNSTNASSSYSFLFHFATYWAQKGSRVLFISRTPLKHLPLTIGNTQASLNPDAFKLIQFMYLANWQDLLKQLYSIQLRHNPVSVIIIKNVENYFKNEPELQSHEDQASLICASLLYAVSACAKIISQPAFLVNEYTSEASCIEKSVVKNFFHNIWELKINKNEKNKTFLELCKLSVALDNEIVNFIFQESLEESSLNFEEIIKNILNTC